MRGGPSGSIVGEGVDLGSAAFGGEAQGPATQPVHRASTIGGTSPHGRWMGAIAPTSADRALWPLPLLAGLLPLIATVVAYLMSIRLGLVPECNPFLEGCVSISRAARHDLP